MWIYEKKLEHPVCVTYPDVKFAKLVITQYGGPDGELSASLRYINQRYSMPTNKAKAVLTDIGTEEMAHMEIIAALVYKLTAGACPEDFEAAGWGGDNRLSIIMACFGQMQTAYPGRQSTLPV